ncbi:MAG: hypothetical protein AAFY15_13680, partial [Cyanobacteria bacterium J06648_11]
EVQIRDRQGNPLAAAIKQAWQESGTWSEGGESGSWSESDTRGQLDVQRAALNQPLQIAIASLEQGTTSGQASTTAVSYDVTVRDGAIDTRFLWSGLVVGLLLSGFAWMTVRTSGQMKISKIVNDSDVSGRGRFGGAGQLVKIAVKVESDETSPSRLRAELAIKNGEGQLVHETAVPIALKLIKDDDGSIDRAVGQCHLNVVLVPEDSYGVSVEVVPDAPVDRTTLQVLQGVRTLGSVEVVEVKPSV